jgi:enoyl-CoA hydratase/carnithine racemase
MTSVVKYTSHDQIASLVLSQPSRLNAVNPELVRDLNSGLKQAIADGVKVAVLRGDGSSFCAGHDLKQEPVTRTEAEERRRLQDVQDVTRAIRQAHFPVVAAVHGYALGAGFEFALACDFILATRSAVFGFPEVSLGLGITGGSSYFLPRLVGLAKARELVLLGDNFTADIAYSLGLLYKVVDDQDLDHELATLVHQICNRPQRAMTLAKVVLDYGSAVDLESAMILEVDHAVNLNAGEDAMNSRARFRERSAPTSATTVAESAVNTKRYGR